MVSDQPLLMLLLAVRVQGVEAVIDTFPVGYCVAYAVEHPAEYKVHEVGLQEL